MSVIIPHISSLISYDNPEHTLEKSNFIVNYAIRSSAEELPQISFSVSQRGARNIRVQPVQLHGCGKTSL